jgi:hypothetical protein
MFIHLNPFFVQNATHSYRDPYTLTMHGATPASETQF